MANLEDPLDLKRPNMMSDTTYLFPKRQKNSEDSLFNDSIEDNTLKRGAVIATAIKDIKDSSMLLQKMIEVFGSDASSRTFGNLLLSLSVLSGSTAEQIQAFIKEETAVGASLLPLDRFLEKERLEHDTHCHNVDKLWHAFVKELDAKSFGQVNIKELSKPSGPSQAKLFILWNCPSYKTRRSIGSHTLDPSNPCLLIQIQRIGLNPSVFTSDMIPIRKDHDEEISWEELYRGWP